MRPPWRRGKRLRDVMSLHALLFYTLEWCHSAVARGRDLLGEALLVEHERAVRLVRERRGRRWRRRPRVLARHHEHHVARRDPRDAGTQDTARKQARPESAFAFWFYTCGFQVGRNTSSANGANML